MRLPGLHFLPPAVELFHAEELPEIPGSCPRRQAKTQLRGAVPDPPHTRVQGRISGPRASAQEPHSGPIRRDSRNHAHERPRGPLSFRTQLTIQPRFGHSQFALHRFGRSIQHGADFVMSHSTEKCEFHDLTLALILNGEALESLIESLPAVFLLSAGLRTIYKISQVPNRPEPQPAGPQRSAYPDPSNSGCYRSRRRDPNPRR